jgi:hypothetical protein
MMKRLLFSALSVLFAFSASAVQKGDYVYTPQGRFLITGDVNLMGTAGSFANLDGWTVVTAGENTVLADNFTVGTEEGSGLSYAQSLVNTVGEGMKYTSNSLDANTTYVISYKMKNAAETAPTIPLSTALSSSLAGANVVAITGTTDGETPTTTTYNRASEISTDWVTYSYAIVGDGTARSLAISLTAMNTSVQIADIQILQAQKVADDRDAKLKADYILSIYNLTDWSQFDDDTQSIYPAEDLITAYGQVATITDDMRAYLTDVAELSPEEIAEACPGFTEDLTTYNKQISKYNEVFNKFISGTMTAYIDVTKDNGEHLGNTGSKVQKASVVGTWTVVSPGARGFWKDGVEWPELGHAQNNAGVDMSAPEFSKEFDLYAGGYTFKADLNGAGRENSKNSWTLDLGLTTFDGCVFVTDAEGNVVASSDTTAVETDVDFAWTTKSVAFTIPADGKYTMHIKAINRYGNNARKGRVCVRWPELYGKTFGEYTADEKMYITAVQEQITAGDNAYQTALDNIASEVNPWGKAPLQACVDTMGTTKQKYDAIFDDEAAIVATYDKTTYEEGATNPNSQMVYEVYSTYVRDLLAANRKFTAVNDTLGMLNSKIDAAEGLASLSIWQASTGLAALEAEIATAKQLDATLRADDYSEENAQAVKDEVAALETAMTNCKNGIDPAKYTAVYADIDFNYTSEEFDNVTDYTEEGGAATIVGKVGSMELSSFRKYTGDGTFSYELGIDVNAQKELPGVLRVGSSEAPVAFNASEVGKNLIVVSMDWWFVRLSGKSIGFEILDEDNNRISGLRFSPYTTTSIDYQTFDIDPDDMGNFQVGNTTGDAGSCADNNLTHWDVVLDYANMQQYLIAKTPKGTVYSTPVAINPELTKPVSFRINCNYSNYPARRSWFDNLKIQKLELNATVKKGDANGDGEVNITDVSWVLDDINGVENEGFNKEAADVNNDGEVNITDVALILDIINGVEPNAEN